MTNPIFVSSAKRRMRTVRTSLVFTLYAMVLMALSLGLVLIQFHQEFININSMRLGLTGYVVLSVFQFGLIVMVAPAMTVSAISGERERQTLDLILVTNTGSFRIVMGKLLDSFLFFAILILSSAPFLSVVFLTGGISVQQVLRTILFLMVSAFAAMSVGIFCSAVFKKTATASIVAYLIIFAIGIGTVIPLVYASGDTLQRLSEDAALMETMTSADAFALVPKLTFINPVVGLASLLVDQTEVVRDLFSNNVSYGYIYYSLLKDISFDAVANLNMALMAALGLVFALAGAAMVRPRALLIGRHPKKK